MQSFPQENTTAGFEADPIVCRCLNVTRSMVVDSVAISGHSNLKDLCRATGAGGGCTACHVRLRALLRDSLETVPVY